MSGRPTIDPGEAGFASGERLAEISRSLVQLYKECYGKGPTKARTYASGDLVVSILEGGFTKGERTLRKHGREDAVQDQREAFQDALREQFIGTVERLVGRKVVTFISGVDPQTETSAELFVLEPDGAEPAGEHQAVAHWGGQARALRQEQAALREEHATVRRDRQAARDGE